jgi:hypothetical protein
MCGSLQIEDPYAKRKCSLHVMVSCSFEANCTICAFGFGQDSSLLIGMETAPVP